MLLFVKGPALAEIAAGRKTATVRLWRSCKLQPGAVLSFNGKVRVILSRVETLARVEDLSEASALAAGYPSRAACFAALRALYASLSPSSPCVILHFVLPAE